ncbi:MAG: hypothetical protein B7Z37_19760 [Verrucomicrobia bacterium 12-59-8]|nr:MAG: hypothetical protein B7Z37_19760 [Verrucomicrobia bacterium 12-59-8]
MKPQLTTLLLSWFFMATVHAATEPLISDVAEQVIAQSTNTGTLYFVVGDAVTAFTALTTAAESSNATLVPNNAVNLTLGGTNGRRSIKVTPAAGLTGTATITLTVTNGAALTASSTFNVTVTAPNTAPTLTGLPSYQINSPGQTPAVVSFTVGDAETAAASLSVVATSSNTSLVPNANIVLGGSGANRTVQITPVAGQTGAAVIQLRVTDALGLSAQGAYIFSVFQTATANNAIRQPHGIFILDSSVGTMINGVSMRDANVRNLPFVDGYLLRVGWAQLEPTSGGFDFTIISNIFSKLPANQKLSLILRNDTQPTWLNTLPGITTWTAGSPSVTAVLPWDAIALERYRLLLVALGNFVVDGMSLRAHPRLAAVNTGIPGLAGGIREPIEINIRDMPGYSRANLQSAVLTCLANTTDNFPNPPVHAGFWAYVDGQDASFGGVTAWEQLRQAILAQHNGVAHPRIGFYMDNPATTRAAADSLSFTGTPNTTFAAPMALSQSSAYSEFQTLGSWSQPFSYSHVSKNLNSSPGDGMDYIFNTFACRCCEFYQADIDFTSYTAEFQRWHDFLNALPVAPAFGATSTRNVNGTVTLTWPTVIGESYQVQFSNDLATWTSLGSSVTAATSSMSWTDDGTLTGTPPILATKRFYRVRVTAP